jgi:hypothetical protein
MSEMPLEPEIFYPESDTQVREQLQGEIEEALALLREEVAARQEAEARLKVVEEELERLRRELGPPTVD